MVALFANTDSIEVRASARSGKPYEYRRLVSTHNPDNSEMQFVGP
jgi:hypothetical protein